MTKLEKISTSSQNEYDKTISLTQQNDLPHIGNGSCDKIELVVQYDNISTLLISDEIETSASDSHTENRLNAQRMNRFRDEFSKHLIQLLREQDFEYGIDTPADGLVRRCFKENEVVLKQWLNQLFIENFCDTRITIGILRVISHIEYHEISPEGVTMAIAAFSHSNIEVQECGIRAFENWCNFKSLEVLKSVSCKEDWLQDYLNQVIADIEEILEL